MTTYQSGDLVLVAFPFTDSAQTKNRPALVLVDSGGADVLVARVTTQSHQTTYDAGIKNWQAAGLLAPSIVRLHKPATLAKVRVVRRLGRLNPTDRQRVSAVLHQVYANW